jgi:predicted HTH transcriptional regulator
VILYSWKKAFIAIPTESIVRDHQEEYYQTIEEATRLGESTPFVEFMLDVILQSIESSVKVSVKSSVNTGEKILQLLRENPSLTLREVSEKLGLTQRAVEKQIVKLKNKNRLQRVGSARKGHWKIMDGI